MKGTPGSDHAIQLDSGNPRTNYSEQGIQSSSSNILKRLRSSNSSCGTLSPAVSSVISKPKRRRSRAKPKPPVTRLAAQNKAHFKAIVHHFTRVGASLDHSLLLQNYPATQLAPALLSVSSIINCPSSCSHHPPPASSSNCPAGSTTITESLKSSLQMVFSCLQHLVHATTSRETINRQNAELEMYKSKTSVLLQALSKAADPAGVTLEEGSPVFSRDFGLISTEQSPDTLTFCTEGRGHERSAGDGSTLLMSAANLSSAGATDQFESTLLGPDNRNTRDWPGPVQVSDDTQNIEASSITYDLNNIDDGDHVAPGEPFFLASNLGDDAQYFHDIISQAAMNNNNTAGAASFLPATSPANDMVKSCEYVAKELESFLLEEDIHNFNKVDSSFLRQTSSMQCDLLAPS